MKRRQFNLGAFGLIATSMAEMSADNIAHAKPIEEVALDSTFEFYAQDSVISDDVFVSGLNDQKHYLNQLIAAMDKPVNVVFIFGGGGLGHERASDTGGIWCPDSYQDLEILRTLYESYHAQLGFIAIACPPVFHSKMLGYSDRVFLDFAATNEEYRRAKVAFVESTQNAYEKGLIPIQPYFDHRFRLLMGAKEKQELKSDYGVIHNWQGAFRAAQEAQSYGVPNFWICDSVGKILSQPFRGNIYHPHEGGSTLAYTAKDLTAKIDSLLIGKPI